MIIRKNNQGQIIQINLDPRQKETCLIVCLDQVKGINITGNYGGESVYKIIAGLDIAKDILIDQIKGQSNMEINDRK